MLTADDLAIRKGRITGSLAAACLGLDPFCTPLGAYLRILGEHPDDGEPAANDERSRGHWLEPALIAYGASEVARDTGCTVAVDHPGTLAHPTIPWAACSIDAMLLAIPGAPRVVGLDDAIVTEPGRVTVFGAEGKTVNATYASTWGEAWTDQIPKHVAVQCTWELLHYPDATAIVLPVLIGAGMELRVYQWSRTSPGAADLELACVEALGAWHARHIVARVPPDPGQRDGDLLASVWRAGERELPDDPRVAALVRTDVALREQIGELERERDGVQVAIKSLLRDATKCAGLWGSVTWNPQRGRLSTDVPMAIDDVRDRAGIETAEIVRDAIEARTTRGPGSRVMRTTWKGAR